MFMFFKKKIFSDNIHAPPCTVTTVHYTSNVVQSNADVFTRFLLPIYLPSCRGATTLLPSKRSEAAAGWTTPETTAAVSLPYSHLFWCCRVFHIPSDHVCSAPLIIISKIKKKNVGV